MSRNELRVPGLARALSHYTDAVRAGDLLFVSGIVPVDAEGRLVGGDDVAAQAEQVFALLGRVLAAAGGRAADVVKVTVFVVGQRRPPADQPGAAGASSATRARRARSSRSAARGPGRRLEVEAVALLGA